VTLYEARQRFRETQTEEAYADYFEIVIRLYREARENHWYYTKLALEDDLTTLGFASQRLGIDAKAIAQERGFYNYDVAVLSGVAARDALAGARGAKGSEDSNDS
jgi:hypothetical protein